MFLRVKDNVDLEARVKAKVSYEHCQVGVRLCEDLALFSVSPCVV